jgi:hypothetical protein
LKIVMLALADYLHRNTIVYVKRFTRGRRVSARPMWLGIAVLLLVAGVFAYFSRASLLAEAHETDNVSPTKAFVVDKDPKPISKSSDTSAQSPASTNQGSASPTSTPNTVAPVVPITKSPHNTDACTTDITDALDSYNHEVQKEKRQLDSKLSFRVGLGISNNYVADYNHKVSDIFDEYFEQAKGENCTWPVSAPPVLPINYTL